MIIFLKLKTWLIALSIVVLGTSLSLMIVYFEQSQMIKKVEASSGDNVSGYAWSENFGWISFNCSNDSSCGTIDYGVNVDSDTGNFSGYAWGANTGWIDFSPVGPYPEDPQNFVNYNSVTGVVTGWAKFLSLGDDGWLKMSGAWNNGVAIDSNGDFYGYAWNGNSDDSGVGWISFNCLDSGICATSNYVVHGDINSLPEATNLSAPNWDFGNACSLGARQAFLRWEFSDIDTDSYQTAFQIVVDDDSDMADSILDTGKIDSSAVQYSLTSDYLDYDAAYYWWIKVWDDNGASSDWIQYDSVSDTDNDDKNSLTFTVYKHEFPNVDFSWLPARPSVGEKTVFVDATTPYGGSSIEEWFWQIPADASINNSAISTPTIIFGSSGNQSISLTAIDSDDYYCDQSQIIDINVSLPIWTETKAN